MFGEERAADVPASTVTVTGEAAVRTEPDEAFVWITLSATESSPGPALADVANRSKGLTTLLDELDIAREDRSTTGISVTEEFDHTSRGRRSLGHCAVASLSVRFTDADLVGRLVTRASEELDARIAGPTWRVSPTNPARLEAASQASANAKAKAAAYAAGVNAKLGRLIALAEPDQLYRGSKISRASARAGAAVGPGMDVDAGEQEVASSIQATFVLEPA